LPADNYFVGAGDINRPASQPAVDSTLPAAAAPPAAAPANAAALAESDEEREEDRRLQLASTGRPGAGAAAAALPLVPVGQEEVPPRVALDNNGEAAGAAPIPVGVGVVSPMPHDDDNELVPLTRVRSSTLAAGALGWATSLIGPK